MAWRLTGDKPLPETVLTQFIDVYMRRWDNIALCIDVLIFTIMMTDGRLSPGHITGGHIHKKHTDPTHHQ